MNLSQLVRVFGTAYVFCGGLLPHFPPACILIPFQATSNWPDSMQRCRHTDWLYE